MNTQQKYCHLLYCPFTGLGLYDGFRGDRWLTNRLAIFNQFVLPSIMNQTNKDSVLWISWRPEEKDNPIVQNFIKSLESIRDLNVLHTFGGLCFWDDKYSDEIESKRLLQHLTDTLPFLKEWVQNRTVLMTIQPSDDMYLSNMVENTQKYFDENPKIEALGYKKGYIMNYATKEIAEYSCLPPTTDNISTYQTNTNPPFYTIKFNPEVFLDPQKHYAYIGPYESHEYVENFLKMDFFTNRGFVVGTHGANISTVWHHRYKGESLTIEQQHDIMILTGTLFSEPFIIRKTWRLRLRSLFNQLPFQGLLRKVYHSLPAKHQRL